jgi:hypothetical protein
VTIALADDAALAGAPFRILRRVDASPHDVILLRHGADAAMLSEAVSELQTLRRQQGDTAQASGLMRVRRGENGRGRRMLPWAPRVLQDLRRAGAEPVPGVGTVPSVQVWLPATHKPRVRT